jgi:threonine/homoserine/homoserine lactone efflux protein
MPGPLLTLTIQKSATAGLRGGFFATLGHAVAEMVAVVAFVLGLASLASSPGVMAAVATGGGVILLYMGWGMIAQALRSPSLSRLQNPGEVPGTVYPWWKVCLSGALVSVANPYWLLWWATVGTTYLFAWGGGRPLPVAAFYLGHIWADFAWFMTVSAAVTFGRRIIADRLYSGLLIVLGGALMLLALYFVYSGLMFARG